MIESKEVRYEDRPANIHEKIMAVIATISLVWVIIDLIIAQQSLGFSGFAVRQWVWLSIISFSWATLAWPVAKKSLKTFKARRKAGKNAA